MSAKAKEEALHPFTCEVIVINKYDYDARVFQISFFVEQGWTMAVIYSAVVAGQIHIDEKLYVHATCQAMRQWSDSHTTPIAIDDSGIHLDLEDKVAFSHLKVVTEKKRSRTR